MSNQLSERKFCYFATKECNYLEPIRVNEGFVQQYVQSNVYKCHANYILLVTSTTAECILEKDCGRKQEVVNGYVCHGDVCPKNLAYDEVEELCVSSCGKKLKYRPSGETLC